MSTEQRYERIPEWTLGDRLRKARSLTGMTIREFADHIGVSHGTVTSAENDARAVRPITLNAYVLATGVSREWLEKGEGTPTPSGPTPGPGLPDDMKAQRLAQLAAKKKGRRSGAPTEEYAPAA